MDRLEPDVALALGGEEFRLRFTMKALAKYHQLTGENLLLGYSADLFRDPAKLTQLLWVALIKNHPDLDAPVDGLGRPSTAAAKHIDDLMELFDPAEYQAVLAALLEALDRATPRPKEKDGAQSETPEAEPGNESGTGSKPGPAPDNDSTSRTQNSGA